MRQTFAFAIALFGLAFIASPAVACPGSETPACDEAKKAKADAPACAHAAAAAAGEAKCDKCGTDACTCAQKTGDAKCEKCGDGACTCGKKAEK